MHLKIIKGCPSQEERKAQAGFLINCRTRQRICHFWSLSRTESIIHFENESFSSQYEIHPSGFATFHQNLRGKILREILEQNPTGLIKQSDGWYF